MRCIQGNIWRRRRWRGIFCLILKNKETIVFVLPSLCFPCSLFNLFLFPSFPALATLRWKHVNHLQHVHRSTWSGWFPFSLFFFSIFRKKCFLALGIYMPLLVFSDLKIFLIQNLSMLYISRSSVSIILLFVFMFSCFVCGFWIWRKNSKQK